jgi:hypothetical protein
LFETTEVIGILFVEHVQAEGSDSPIDAMEAGRLDHAGNLGHVAVRAQTPFRDPNKAVRARLGGAKSQDANPKTGQQD